MNRQSSPLPRLSHRLGAWLVVLGLGLSLALGAQTTDRELTLDGAIKLATQMLAKDAKNPLGLQLAKLALALDPTQRDALLLISAVQDNLPLEEPSETILDQGLTFANFLLRQGDEQAKQTSTRAQAWANLYYGLGLSLAPRHERGLSLALRLKRPLNDLGVEALLAAVNPLPVSVAMAAANGEAGSPSPVPGVAIPTTVELRLKGITVADIEVSTRRPLSAINRLNRTLADSKLLIRPLADVFRVTDESSNEGVPYFYGRHIEDDGPSRYFTLRNTNAWRVAIVLCRQMGVGV